MFSRGVVYMFIATLAFSLMQVGVKYLDEIPFFELILFRSVISLVMSYGAIRRLGLKPLGNNRPMLLQRGVYGTIALSLLFLSIQKLPLASAATLAYLSPIFTALFAIFLLGERIRPLQWISFGIAFTGVVFVKGFDSDVDGLYVLAAVVGAAFAGLAYNTVRRLKDHDHPVVVVFYFPLVATPIMAIWSASAWVMPTGWDWIILICIGILTQIGQVFMSHALQMEEAGPITSIKFFGLINAFIFSIFLFKEHYAAIHLAGIFLITLGVMLNLYIAKRRPGA